VRKSLEKNKITALLCASAGLLAVAENYDGQHQPIAEGRKVVGHFRVEGLLKSLGKVKFIAGPIKEPMVVVDGNLITGRNPESSKSFGEAVVKLLK
jgi:putative intracellular protease/amidase